MKTKMNELENSMVEVTVNANKDAWKKAQEDELKKAAENVEIDGFRKGNAPLNKVKQHVNQFDVLSSAADTLLNDMFRKAIEDHDLWPVANPELNVSKMDEEELEVIFNIAIK
ncbi:MAG: trigger factor family protein, partial [Erysipelotrichales bacterium]